MANNRLSKSTFIRGLQCEKSLYLYKHHYTLKDPISPSLQAVFDQGTNIGILAQEIFPDGADASPENHFKMVESVGKTLDFISQGKSTIYEATFQYNNVLAALDILVKDEEGWKAYEVKALLRYPKLISMMPPSNIIPLQILVLILKTYLLFISIMIIQEKEN